MLLWGFLKDSIYCSNPQSLGELEYNIEQTIARLTQKHFTNSHDTQYKVYMLVLGIVGDIISRPMCCKACMTEMPS